MSEIIYKTLEVKEIEQEIVAVESIATALQVTDNTSYLQAGDILTGFKGLEKKIKEYFKPLKESAHKAWKVVCDRENQEIEKLQPGLKYLNLQMTTWNITQERIRKEKEEILRQEALKQEEEERLQAALQAEKEGNKAEAEAILEEPVFIPTPIVQKEVPKSEGLTMTTTWKWRIFKEILIPREYLCVDEIKINGVVRALKDKTNINGIEVYPEQSMRRVRT